MKIGCSALLSGWLALAALNAHADVTIITNRTDWETAAGGGTGDILDSFTSGFNSSVITRTGFYVTGAGVGPTFPALGSPNSVDGTGYLRAILTGTNALTFTFDAPIIAIGYDLNPPGTDVGFIVNLWTNGVFVSTYQLPTTDVTGFRGIVFDAPVLTFDLTASGSSAGHGIDNLEIFSAVVPEPSVLALAAIGAAVACVSKRRHFNIR